MKVLILVQSIEKAGYNKLIQTQKETWDSVPNSDTRTIFYYPDLVKNGLVGQDLYLRSHLDISFMYHNFIDAMKFCLQFEWDYIFKTDNSAYVCKSELVKILSGKPRDRFFGGRLFYANDTKNPNNFIWGEGMALSRDVVKYLVSLIPIHRTFRGVDDVQTSKVLYGKFPFTAMPVHEYYRQPKPIPLTHVYRCKKGPSPDHVDDIFAMKDIHQTLIKYSNHGRNIT